MREPDAAAPCSTKALRALPGDPAAGTRGLPLAARRQSRRRWPASIALSAPGPRHAASWSDRGKDLGVLSATRTSMESLERAIALRPEAAAPWLNKALAEETGEPSRRRGSHSFRMFLGARSPAAAAGRDGEGSARLGSSRLGARGHPAAPFGSRGARAGRPRRPWHLLGGGGGPHAMPPTGRISDVRGAARTATRPVAATTAPSPSIPHVSRAHQQASLLRKAARRRESRPSTSLASTRTPWCGSTCMSYAASESTSSPSRPATRPSSSTLKTRGVGDKADSLGRHEGPAEALAAVEAAPAARPAPRPRLVPGANALAKLGRKEESLAAYDRAWSSIPRRRTPTSTRPTSSSR